jgi:hypothetical protein
LLENAVYIHFRLNGIKMYHFKEKGGCNFVLFNQTTCHTTVQVCYQLNNDNKQREINGLLEALNFFDLAEGYIVTLRQKDTLVIDNKKISVVPAYQLAGIF